MNIAQTTIVLLIPVLLFHCQKKADPAVVLAALEQAVQQHYYFYEDGPVFTDEDYEAAARAIDSHSAWTPGSDPAASLIARIHEAPAERQEDVMRRAFNALLGGHRDLRQNYYISGKTADLLNDPDRNAGAGVVLLREGYGRFRVVDVLEGSPAHKAGIPQKGILEKIDGRPVLDLELEDVVARIRGEAGTALSLTIDGKNYDVVRGQYTVQLLRNAEWNVNGKTILYTELRSAARGAARDLESLLMRSKNPDALVLDLRKLNQGDFDEAFAIADLLIGRGQMGQIKRKGVAARPMQADANVLYSGKVFVLVSNHTSPHVKTLAMALRLSDNVHFIGPDMPLVAYAGVRVPIEGDGYAMIINAVIEPAPEMSATLQPESEIRDFIPVNPPSKPDPADPAHATILKHL